MIDDVRRVLRVPGKLAVGCTSLAGAYPHGGTAIGLVRAIAVSPGPRTKDVIAEEYGGEIVESVLRADTWTLAAVLRQWDGDLLAKAMPNSATGSVSQERLITSPGTVRAGSLLSDRAIVLVFSPDAVDEHPFCVFHRALPLLEERAVLDFSPRSDLEFAMMFRAVRNASAKSVSLGMRGDITL